MIFNYRMWRNVLWCELQALSSNKWFSIGCQTPIPIGVNSLLPKPECGKGPSLIHPNKWILTVRCSIGGVHTIHLCDAVRDSNHLLPEPQSEHRCLNNIADRWIDGYHWLNSLRWTYWYIWLNKLKMLRIISNKHKIIIKPWI